MLNPFSFYILGQPYGDDAVSVLHSLWAAVFLISRRKTTAKLWHIYIIYMSVFLPVQYLLVLGWPPGLCKGKFMFSDV